MGVIKGIILIFLSINVNALSDSFENNASVYIAV